MNKNVFVFSIGLFGLGITSLISGDFALQWQPVPDTLLLRQQLAYVNGAVLVLGAAAMMVSRWRARAAMVLAGYLTAWSVGLHGPRLVFAPADVSVWLGLAEILALASGAAMLVVCALADATAPLVRRSITALFGLCAIVFGLSHIVYLDFTASMVPAWLPFPLAWAALTGAGHAAAGSTLVIGRFTKLAATAHAAMMACFVALLHLPRVFGDPYSHLEWVMLFIASALAGSAWLIRSCQMDNLVSIGRR